MAVISMLNAQSVRPCFRKEGLGPLGSTGCGADSRERFRTVHYLLVTIREGPCTHVHLVGRGNEGGPNMREEGCVTLENTRNYFL